MHSISDDCNSLVIEGKNINFFAERNPDRIPVIEQI